MRFLILVIFCIGISPFSSSQSHHALDGSTYAGSLGINANPASSLTSKDSFDIAFASLHFKNFTNFLRLGYAPLLAKNPSPTLEPSTGDYERSLNTNLRINLINARFLLNGKNAFGAGVNFRSIINMNASHYNLTDTTKDIISFLEQNTNSLPFKGDAKTSNWLEYYLNYSRNIIDNRKYVLNAGTNLKFNKGILGLVGSLSNLDIQKTTFLGAQLFEVKNADFLYGYSTTLPSWDNALPFKDNIRSLMNASKTGMLFDVGGELLIKDNASSDWFYSGSDYNYAWKIGFSLLDLGFTRYTYYPESAVTKGIKQNLSPDVLLDKFLGGTNTISDFNDTLQTIVDSFSALVGNFKIYLPSKWKLNIDRKISDHVYLNASLSIPLSLVNTSTHYVLKEMGYFSLTPRYETRRFGFYVPITYSRFTKFNMGAAMRAGPLIIGVNNLNIFNNNTSLQNLSGYLSFMFRFRKKEKKERFRFLQSPRNVS